MDARSRRPRQRVYDVDDNGTVLEVFMGVTGRVAVSDASKWLASYHMRWYSEPRDGYSGKRTVCDFI